MKALFKHEFSSYLHMPASYAIAGLYIMIVAVYFTLDNMRGRSGDLSALYSTMGTLFMFIVPILTSRVIAEDRHSGVEILLLSSPTEIPGMIIGKFLAVFCILAAIIALTSIFPVLMLLFTIPHPLPLLGYYIGLLMLGAGLTAIGVFASAVPESQVIAAIVSFVALLTFFIMRPISAMLGGSAAKVLNYISPFARYEEFGRGVISIQSALYFLSFTFVFLFLAVCIFVTTRRNGNMRGRVYARIGATSVIVITILINLIAHLYPLSLDFSVGKRYSISDSTARLLSALDRNITVYGLFDEGKSDRDYLEVSQLLLTYSAHSNGRVRVHYVDPDLDLQIITRLDQDGSKGLRKNDYYVSDGFSGVRVRYQDLFLLEYDQRTSTWFNTGSTAERAFSEAIRDVAFPTIEISEYMSNGYALFTSGKDTDLPEFHRNYSELLVDVPQSSVIPHEFHGLYFPNAVEFDMPAGSTALVVSPGDKPLAVAWVDDAGRHVLVGSSDFLDESIKIDYPAYYAVNLYFANCIREWVAADAGLPEIEPVYYDTGELQIPRQKADYIGFLTIIVFPSVIFVRGFIVWHRRRFL